VATNRRLVSNEGLDWYKTPEWGTEALLSYEKFSGPIWEPACGDGAMSEVMKRFPHHYEVWSTNIVDRGYGEGVGDFLEATETPCDLRGQCNIVTNPPFNIANEFILHALKLVHRGKVAMLLRTAFLEGSKRYNMLFKEHPPSRVYVFSEHLSMYPAGQEKASGGTTCHSWFVWDVIPSSDLTRAQIIGRANKPPELFWLPPGTKR